jgi:hypothetical protein
MPGCRSYLVESLEKIQRFSLIGLGDVQVRADDHL